MWAPNGKYKGLGCLRPQTSVNSMHILAAKHNVPASAVSRLVRVRSSPRGLVGFLFGFLGGTVGSLCERVCVCVCVCVEFIPLSKLASSGHSAYLQLAVRQATAVSRRGLRMPQRNLTPRLPREVVLARPW